MKRFFLSLLVFILIAFAVPFSVDSAEIITNTNVDLSSDSSYYENLYVGAGRSNISSYVESDLTIISGESVISNEVGGDVFVAGGYIDFIGKVAGDLRIIGGSVSVSGEVGGDLLIIGADVFVSKNAKLSNDIFLVGGKIVFEGSSPEKIKVVASEVYINGELDGESEITAQSLIIGSSSIINGSFSYYSPQKFIKNDGAQVWGTVNYNKINTLRDTGLIKKTIVNFLNFWLLLRFITTLIIAFILIYVFRVFAVEINKIISSSFWKSLLAGFLTTILLPISFVFLILTLVALPIGFLLLLTFIFLLILSPAISGIFLGSWLQKMFGKRKEFVVDFHSATIGVVLYTLLQFIPIIGDLLRAALILVALGATVRYLRVSIIK